MATIWPQLRAWLSVLQVHLLICGVLLAICRFEPARMLLLLPSDERAQVGGLKHFNRRLNRKVLHPRWPNIIIIIVGSGQPVGQIQWQLMESALEDYCLLLLFMYLRLVLPVAGCWLLAATCS